MALTFLITITLACMAWSLWIRRVTWSCRWEVAATLNIALQAAAVALMSPMAADTLGRAIHSMTGVWNLPAYLGHDCYIVAASAIVYNAIGRLADDSAMQKMFTQYIERPATLCIPILLALFSMSVAGREYSPDLFTMPTDGWLAAYWLVLCGTLAYLLVFGARALLVLRKNEDSRRIANIYLFATGSGILACATRILTSLVPELQPLEDGKFVWVFACMCGGVFALASAHSWLIKTKWFSKAAR
ncbi:hypothetical protein [Mycolicibacterium phocaicum]|uniref:hypothetical protein n=1 Tax=Mycolicibacterium phocaicum TaxID=319706 RepID=UPI001CFAB85A|nr:hypothetical protein [Mycolicibacterium phocaicum]UCZ63152.1 hypothetical protein LHJ73_13765 [Mycolicibacterium phocaicum]